MPLSNLRGIDDNLRDALELEQRDPGMMAGSCLANRYGIAPSATDSGGIGTWHFVMRVLADMVSPDSRVQGLSLWRRSNV